MALSRRGFMVVGAALFAGLAVPSAPGLVLFLG